MTAWRLSDHDIDAIHDTDYTRIEVEVREVEVEWTEGVIDGTWSIGLGLGNPLGPSHHQVFMWPEQARKVAGALLAAADEVEANRAEEASR